MNIRNTKWHLPSFDWHAVAGLVRELSISPITAKVLLNRGIATAEEGRVFFNGTLSDLSSPWDLPGMEAAVQRIVRGIRAKEKTLVFGDYDVDGITATAMVVSFLKHLDVPVGYYIPERSAGYGLTLEALQDIHRQGYSLIITVDCGISATAEIAYGRKLGLDFVITDHHEPGDMLPDCEAVINPKAGCCRHQARELAGVGVAFKLLQGLAERLGLAPESLFSYLDLVTLGTIADVVPLVGENRIIVKNGLALLQDSGRTGVRALLEAVGVGDGQLTPNQVAYALAPRLNAAGRMASPLIALEMLLTHSVQRARELALKLNELNATRQLLVQQVMQEALAMIEQEAGAWLQPVTVLASPLWHPGVIGIVAAKLADMLFKPVILLTVEGELAKGSGRSVPGFDLFQGIRHCQDLLVKAGGHSQAVGLTVALEHLEEFRDRINCFAAEVLKTTRLEPTLPIEAEVLPGQLDFQLLDELAQLQPFGYGNPEPVLALRSTIIRDCRTVGKEGEHLKFQVLAGQEALDGIGFNMAAVLKELDLTGPVDLAFRLQRNLWNGQAKLQLVLEDIKPCRETKPRVNAMCLDTGAGPVEAGGPVHRCRHGEEQFRRLVQLILETVQAGAPVYLVFPTQRVLALYERLLTDVLVKYDVTCGRYHNGRQQNPPEQVRVLLAAGHLLDPPPGAKVVQLAYPDWDDGIGAGHEEAGTVLGFKEPAPGALAFVREPIPARGKLTFLKDLCTEGSGPLFIYTNRLNQVTYLYQQLRLLLPERKQRIWYYHHNLSFTQKELVLNAVSHGLAEIVVANEFLEFLIPERYGAGTRLLLDAPYSVEELYLKTRPARPGMTVYGVWDWEELCRNELTLQAIFPEEPLLEGLLFALKELSPSLEEDPAAVVKEMRLKFSSIQAPTVQFGLDILREISECPDITLDYHQTRVYQAAQKEKRAFAKLKHLEQTGDYTAYLFRGAP